MANRTIYLKGTARWARLKEDNRDLGSEQTPDDIQRKIDEVQGWYLMDLVFPEGTTRKEVAGMGIPTTGMIGQLLKEDDDGTLYYKCKRAHYNPNAVDKETGEKGIVFGPPRVLHSDNATDWNWESDGLIGNGSEVTVKINKWEGDKATRVSMDAVRVDKLEPYGEGF